MVFDLVLAEFSAVMSYWFVRRSFEKRNTPQLSSISKKKVVDAGTDITKEIVQETQTKNAVTKTFKAEGNHLPIAIDIIKKFEGCKLEAYQDTVGVWTIGYGKTKNVKSGMKITQEEAEKFLTEEITEYENAVLNYVRGICNDNQIASLISFAYNLGISNLKKSTLLKTIKANPQNFEAKIGRAHV